MVAGKTGVGNVALARLFDPAKNTLWLTVAGKNYLLSQYNATFALNEIPSASCTLATGEKVTPDKGALALSASEDLAKELSGVGLAPATVTLDLTGSDWEPNSDNFPNGYSGKKVIFEGYYAGLSYARVSSKIQLTVSLVHKLVDLTFGSIFSKDMHPSNPSSLIVDAVTKPLGGCGGGLAGGGGVKGVWTKTAFLGKGLPPADSFGDSLIEVLKCIAKLNLFQLRCNRDIGSKTGNDAATELIEGMTSHTGELSAPLNSSPFSTSISSYVGAQLSSFKGTTFWDLLVSKWCTDFMMAVSPLPSKADGGPDGNYAAIIPNIPTLKTPYKELYLNDYVDFEMKSTQHKPLMAVGIFAPTMSTTGAKWTSEPQDPPAGSTCIGGQYPVDKVKATGQFLALKAPAWIQAVLTSSAGAGAYVNGGNTASNPAAQNGARPVTFTKNRTQINKILDKIAHTYYMSNALRGRTGSFGSKLRFDIAPGATLLLKSTKAPTAKGGFVKSLPTDLYVQVVRITYNIGADTPVARTSYDCVSIRNEQENADSDFAVDKHPFFEETWAGDTLVKGWDFTAS
tara:strand:- start:10855 stop:12561 length:1707 start_codon:yes stop_codon:yes gene_type:complete